MLRITSSLLLIIFTSTAATHATVFLQSSAPTSLSDGLVSYTLRAVSDSGEEIWGISNPTIVPHSFFGAIGLHQVWTPITNYETPTRGSQLNAGILWSDTWRPYDSYFFFDSSLVLPENFTETNSGTGGAPLPNAGFGAPLTGFGNYGNTGTNATRFVASDLRGPDVALAQLVMEANDAVLVNLTILGDFGSVQRNGFCVGCPVIELFEVDDLFIPGGLPGDLITGGPLPTNDDDDPDAGINWLLESLVGPAGPVVGATVDPDTGVFSWQSLASSERGLYIATIRGTNDNIPTGTDTGILQFLIPIPEPASVTLLGLAMVGALSLIRRH